MDSKYPNEFSINDAFSRAAFEPTVYRGAATAAEYEHNNEHNHNHNHNDVDFRNPSLQRDFELDYSIPSFTGSYHASSYAALNTSEIANLKLHEEIVEDNFADAEPCPQWYERFSSFETRPGVLPHFIFNKTKEALRAFSKQVDFEVLPPLKISGVVRLNASAAKFQVQVFQFEGGKLLVELLRLSGDSCAFFKLVNHVGGALQEYLENYVAPACDVEQFLNPPPLENSQVPHAESLQATASCLLSLANSHYIDVRNEGLSALANFCSKSENCRAVVDHPDFAVLLKSLGSMKHWDTFLNASIVINCVASSSESAALHLTQFCPTISTALEVAACNEDTDAFMFLEAARQFSQSLLKVAQAGKDCVRDDGVRASLKRCFVCKDATIQNMLNQVLSL